MELLELRGVGKSFKQAQILKDVDIVIEEGDILGVIGQSGGGKTTLLNLITGFIEPSEGQILYYSKAYNEKRDLNENLHKIKRFFGFTPQHNSFYPKLTVRENLLHFGRLYDIDEANLNTNIKNLLQFTRLSGHENKLADQLSGGMQKRLDISCSLVHKPKILILDEPTADLDPILQKEILHLLQEVNKQGVTIIIASHQLDSIEQTCNKVAIVHGGTVQCQGLLDDIRNPPQQDHFTISVSGEEEKGQIMERLKTYPIKKIIDREHTLVVYPADAERTMSRVLNLVKSEHLKLHAMHLRKQSLSDVFEKIVHQQ